MISITAILDTRSEAKNGYPVKIRVYCDILQKHRYCRTGMFQKGNRLKYTSRVLGSISEAEERAEYCNSNKLNLEKSVEIVRKGIPKTSLNLNFLEYMDRMADERKEIGMGYKHFHETKAQILNFTGGDFPINDIDRNWVESFKVYKLKYGKGRGGVSYYLRTMRSVFKKAQLLEGVRRDNPFLGMIKQSRSKRPPMHTPNDLKKLFSFAPKEGTSNRAKSIMERNIDIFLFQFAIGGHDYADIANLKWTDVRHDRVRFYRFKLRNFDSPGEFIDNPLSPFALGAIGKHGTPDEERVFGWIPDPRTERYTEFTKSTGRSLGRVCNTLCIDRLGTKSTRYLFNSFAGEIGIRRTVIEQIQGHKSDSISGLYARRFPNKIIDAEFKKVWDLVF
ncbi:MAG TPA: phage integrase SAM-like domain-containing protein [Pricia sp.]|nr:phage integrase SAM-like domain-containing protein [Pricia sp.]